MRAACRRRRRFETKSFQGRQIIPRSYSSVHHPAYLLRANSAPETVKPAATGGFFHCNVRAISLCCTATRTWKRPFSLNRERNTAVNEPNFWTQSAEAMELTIEGNRLIAREIADLARDLWNRIARGLVAMLSAEHRHLPPI
jgi:hypothetical protein